MKPRSVKTGRGFLLFEAVTDDGGCDCEINFTELERRRSSLARPAEEPLFDPSRHLGSYIVCRDIQG